MSNLGVRALNLASTNVGNPAAEEQPHGSNRSPKIDIWNQAVGVPLGSPWCMSFVYAMVSQAANELGVPNTLYRTGSCTEQYHQCIADGIVMASPQAGDVFLVKGKKPGVFVHTGFVAKVNTDGTVQTVEGNTNDSGSPEGYGVFRRSRRVSSLVFLRI